MTLHTQLATAEEWAALCHDAYDTDPTPDHKQLWLDALADLRLIRATSLAAYDTTPTS